MKNGVNSMQKRMKNATKLYITMVIAILLAVALTLSLYFTLGSRSNSGRQNGSNDATVSQIQPTVNWNDSDQSLTLDEGGTTLGTSEQITIGTSNTNIPVYIRASLVITATSGSTQGMYIESGAGWTYAADNYLYYSGLIGGMGNKTATTALITAIKGYAGEPTISIQVIAEVIQQEAAQPNVKISGNAINGGAITSAFPSYGVKSETYKMNALTNETASNTAKIENNGRLDLNVRVRLSSSEWTIDSAQVGAETRTVERDANSGYYLISGKLAVGETLTLTFIDANRNNDIVAGTGEPAETVSFLFQDYAVAYEPYAVVNGNGQNYAAENGVVTLTSAQVADARIYSYNNVNKFVYVQAVIVGSTNETVDFNAAGWGKLEGELTAVSAEPIAPKSYSQNIFDSTWASGLVAETQVQIKVWTAIPVQSPTISVVRQTGTSDYSQPIAADESAALTGGNLVLDNANATYAGITNATTGWANLRIRSKDYSDLLVRVSLGLSWGTYVDTSGTWTTHANSALDLSPFYGDGFSYNSGDGSLTYSYNLSKDRATSPILEFPATDTTNFSSALDDERDANQGYSLKLTIMVEAIYAEGSQLDVIKFNGAVSGVDLGNYYVYLSNYTSMVQTQGIITYTPNGTLDWDKYLIYATNNFPIGARVSVAIQWGTVTDSNNWQASDTLSEIVLDDYIDKDYWEFDTELGGYNYKYSIPGKSATKPLFSTAGLLALKTAIDNEFSKNTSLSENVARLVVMVETTHKI